MTTQMINCGYGSEESFIAIIGHLIRDTIFTSYGSGSTYQKVTVPTVPVPVSQHCLNRVTFSSMNHITDD
jgi:hypothetical protein